MDKRIIAFFILVFVTISAGSQALSQSGCSLTEANSPSVGGLRLGSSTEQLLAVFPGSTKRKEVKDALERAKSATGSEAEYIQFDPSTDVPKEQFTGVLSVSVGLHKGRVVDFSVTYADATLSTIDEWVAKVAEMFKLPGTQAWMVGPSENPNKVLKCDGLEIEAALQGGSASIRIRNK